MKKILITVLLALLGGAHLTAPSAQTVAKIHYDDRDTAYAQLKPLWLTYEDVQEEWAQALVNSAELAAIRGMGFEVEVLYADIRDRSAVWRAQMGRAWTSYADLVTAMQTTAAAHPDICRLHWIGQTSQGRNTYVMEITDNPDVDETDEAEVRIVGSIHGNEFISFELGLLLIQHLTTEYGVDPQITGLVNNREIWIQPSVNPDGHELGTRSNARGVDLNRNHGYMWADSGGSGPFSELETQFLREYSLERNFSMSLSFHGVTTYFNYCWNFTGEDAFDKAHLIDLGNQYTVVNNYTVVEGYDWYQTNGDTNDWSYGCRGGFDITIETPGSNDGNITGDWNDNRAAMLYIIDQAAYGLSGVVTDAGSSLPLEALVTVAQHPIMVYTDPLAGDYHRPLQTGTYDIDVWANGYEPTHVSSLSVVNQNSTVQNVALTPNNEHWAAHVCWNILDPQYRSYANQWYELWLHRGLGPPDGIPGSIGNASQVCLDMGEGAEIPDLAGDDLIVYEANIGDGNETFSIYGSSDGFLGPWVYIGTGTGTTTFDLSGTGLASGRYFLLEDDASGSTLVNYAGFDLDALGRLPEQPGCGSIVLNRGSFLCDDRIAAVTVVDQDLNQNPGVQETASAILSSDSNPTGATVVLTELSTDSDVFQGSILISDVPSGAGYLLVAKGDTITARYDDVDCQGLPRSVYDSAVANCDAPDLLVTTVIVDDSTGDGDGVADPGESVVVEIGLTNSGNETATNIGGILSDASPFTNISDSSALWPDLDPSDSAVSLPNHFTIEIGASTPVGTTLDFVLDLTADGYATQVSFVLYVGVEKVLVINDGSGSASTIATHLTSLGYPIVEESAAASDPATWGNYAFLVWSCGDNLDPVSALSYRSDLIAYVAGGEKLWIEGGEVGYDAADSPGYPSFAANVLHVVGWDTDSSGNITVVETTHPLMTDPHALPTTMNCGYSAYGDQDAMDAALNATRVCSWTGQPGESSIIAVDPDGDPVNGGQLVYTAFDFAELASASQQPAVENIARWLAEVPDPATSTWFCGSSVNGDTYAVASPFVLGGTFQGSVGISAPNIGAVVAGYLGRLTFPIWGQEGLVDVSTPEVLGLSPGFGTSPVVFTKVLPHDPTYAGFHVFTQAAGFGGGVISLTCAYDCTVGY